MLPTWKAFGSAQLTQEIVPTSPGAFGISLAVRGNFLAVGSPEADVQKGAAHVYVLQSGQWILDETLVDANGKTGDRFGDSVAIEDTTVVVGAPHYADGVTPIGAAFTFQRDTSWQMTRFTSPNVLFGSEQFGAQVAVRGKYGAATATSAGLFVFENIGSTTAQQITITDGQFFTVASGGNGLVAAQKTLAGGETSYFELGQSDWQEVGSFGVAGNTTEPPFTLQVDGSYALLGDAPSDTSLTFIRLHLFMFHNGTWQDQMTPLQLDEADGFPQQVAMSGLRVAVSYSDVVRVFDRVDSSWSQVATIDAPSVAPDFGQTIAVHGDILFVGSPGYRSREGRVYVYTITVEDTSKSGYACSGGTAPSSWIGIAILVLLLATRRRAVAT